MSSILTEMVVDAVYNKLSNVTYGINVQIAAINTELTDLTVRDIAKIYKGPRFVNNVFPSIVIWPEDSPGNEQMSTVSCDHNITIWCAETHESDPEKLHKKIWRTQRAIFDCIRGATATDGSGTTLDGTVDYCLFQGLRYDSPWYIERENVYLEVAGVRFLIGKEETP